MNKILSKSKLSAFLVFSVLFISLIGMISASVNVNDYVTTSVTIGQHNTAVQFTLVNPASQSYDNVSVPFSISGGKLVITDSNMPVFLNDLLASYDFSSFNGNTGTISFKVSDIINGINFQATVADGATYPTFSNVVVDGTILFTVNTEVSGFPVIIPLTVDTLLTQAGITNVQTYLNDLAQNNPSSVVMVGDASFVKSGNVFTLTYNKGFADAQASFPDAVTYVQSIIGASYNYVGSVQNLIDLAGFDLTGFIGSNGIVVPFDYQSYLDFGNSASIDLTSLGSTLQDGTYNSIPVSVNDATASVSLTLVGFTTTPAPEPTPSGNPGHGHRTVVSLPPETNPPAPITTPETVQPQTPTGLGITGGVIGNFLKSGAGVGTFIALILVVILGITITSVRRNKLAKSKPEVKAE